MSIYQVQVGPPGISWQDIEAANEQEAAEKACGLKVVKSGPAGNLCARVRLKGDLSQHTATAFYRPT